MYEVRKEIKISCGHHIEGHKDPITGGPGKCSRKHGHNYVLALCVRTMNLVTPDFVIDFYWLGHILKQFSDRWDHQYLNDLEEFEDTGVNTTAENMAKFLYLNAARMVQEHNPNARLVYAEVKETDTTYARYYANDLSMGIIR